MTTADQNYDLFGDMDMLDTEIANARDVTTVDTLAVIFRNQAIHFYESAIVAIGRPIGGATSCALIDRVVSNHQQSVRMLIRLARQSLFKFTAAKDDPARRRR